MKTERAWGWPIALDLFLAGLGGGIMIVSAVADLFFGYRQPFPAGELCCNCAVSYWCQPAGL